MTFNSARKTVLIGLESSTAWGTLVAATKDVGLIQDVNDNITREVIESKGLGKVETQQITTGMVDVAQSISMEYQHGRMFQYILGSVTHTNTSADFKHTFVVTSNPPSFSMESGEKGNSEDVVLKHSGCLVESAELSIALNEVLKLKIDAKGKTITSTNTASTAVVSTLPVFPHNKVDVKINGASATEVQNWSMKFNKKVEKSGGLFSVLPQQGKATELGFEFSGNLGFTSTTFQELFMGGAAISSSGDPASFNIQLIGDNGTAYGSGQRKITVTFTNCQFNTFNKVASVGNLIFIDLAGKGTFSAMETVDNINDTTAWS